MRTLRLHCSEFEYESIKKTPVAEETNIKEGEFENFFVVFTCYEKEDENRNKEIVREFTEWIKTDIERIKPDGVLIYPYAHLSKNLGSPKLAKEFLKKIVEKLKEQGINVHKSPFGWYKKFSLECKGHPLSEAYREF